MRKYLWFFMMIGLTGVAAHVPAADRLSAGDPVCEHKIKTAQCDECRYELGLVKVDPAVAEKLLTAVRVQARPLRQTIRMTGEVQCDATRVVDIATPGAGRVTRVNKLLGDAVRPGDLLALVHSPELSDAKAAYIEASARFQLAERTRTRERILFEKKVCSEADYLNAEREYRTAEAFLASTEKRLQLFGLEADSISRIKAAREDTGFAELSLKAPRAGTIIAQNITPGKVVDSSQTLYTIADLSHLWTWGDLYERDLAVLRDRMNSGVPVKARVYTTAFKGEVFPGVIDFVDSRVDEHTRVFRVRVQTPNVQNRLKPGMFVTIEADISSDRRALFVPKEALLSDEGKTFVFVRRKDGLWMRRDVKAGPTQGAEVEIIGLPAGTVIAGRGAFMLKGDILREKMGAGCAD